MIHGWKPGEIDGLISVPSCYRADSIGLAARVREQPNHSTKADAAADAREGSGEGRTGRIIRADRKDATAIDLDRPSPTQDLRGRRPFDRLNVATWTRA